MTNILLNLIKIFPPEIAHSITLRLLKLKINTITQTDHPILKQHFLGLDFSGAHNYYYLLLLILMGTIFVCIRLQDSRLGRAWVAIREDEVAAQAMGINTRNVKLLAFALGASFGAQRGLFCWKRSWCYVW